MSPEAPAGIVVTRSMVWAVASAAAVIAGSLGTWVTAGPFSVGGTAEGGDGIVTLVLGIVALVLIVLERARPLTGLVAGAALVIGVVDASSVVRAPDNELISVSLGWGLIILPLGAASLLAWSVRELLGRPGRTRAILGAGALVAVAITIVVMATSGRFDVDDEEQDAATPAVQTTASTTEEETTTESTSAPEVSRGELGDALTLTGSDGLVVRVTVTGVVDPLPVGEFDSETPGKRTIGIEMRMTNQGSSTYDDSPSNGATVIFGNDEEADSAGSSDACTSPSPRIAAGDSRRICLPFEVDENASLRTFQFALDSGFSDDGGEWELPRRGTPGISATPGAGSASDSGASLDANPPTTSCDQNIEAGPSTTCGFADDVFREYAAAIQEDEDENDFDVDATSPATGMSYAVSCESDGDIVSCRAEDGAFVTFPQRAAEVY